MKLYAPSYYKKFKCIADKCDHSCCIGWEIDIDGKTLEKYNNLKGGYGSVIADSIVIDDTPHFKLDERDRCPHLNENGLCNIITSCGKDHLCDICREHPRFYNYTEVAEVGIGMSCTEAARIILSSPDYAEIKCIGESDTECDEIGFDGRGERVKIYRILQDKTLNYNDRLAEIYERYSIASRSDGEWLDALDSLEYLDFAHRELFMSYSAKRRPDGSEEYLERFLAYFIYRHVTEAFNDDDLRARLSFCLFCERLFASMIVSEKAVSLQESAVLARIISEEIEYSDDNTAALTAVAEDI